MAHNLAPEGIIYLMLVCVSVRASVTDVSSRSSGHLGVQDL